jgi:hypothetical protein
VRFSIYGYENVSLDGKHGGMEWLPKTGMTIFGIIIIVANLKILTFTHSLNICVILILFMSVFSYFLTMVILNGVPNMGMTGMLSW